VRYDHEMVALHTMWQGMAGEAPGLRVKTATQPRSKRRASAGHAPRPTSSRNSAEARSLLFGHSHAGAQSRNEHGMRLTAVPLLREGRFRDRRTCNRGYHHSEPVLLQGVRDIVGRSTGERHGRDKIMTHGRECCIHCGSVNIQEARRTADEITFRCLHCWKTFTRRCDFAVLAPMNWDDAA
jgi:hypothetical protein